MSFRFDQRIAFDPAAAEAALLQVPAAPGVLALRGADAAAEPYLTRAADLRRRLRAVLAPPVTLDAAGVPLPSKRLNLRDRIRSIEWTATGSDFESNLLLYSASLAIYGEAEARRRLRLHTPYAIRVTRTAAHPRAYVTNRLAMRALGEYFGPFPSRGAAERYCDAVLDLFQLRRCWEELVPTPEHPGCVYGEIGKCLAPCRMACTPEAYSAEAAGVFAFFDTGGESRLQPIAREREAASEGMDFEAAAALHRQWERAHTAASLPDEAVRPLGFFSALVVQAAAATSSQDASAEAAGAAGDHSSRAESADDALLFLLARGAWHGPVRLSTRGIRAVREQTAVGSSLFAQPLMLAPVPLAGEPAGTAATTPAATPEDRARAALAQLEAMAAAAPPPAGAREAAEQLGDALSLFRRWYFRPEKSRSGACFFPPREPSTDSKNEQPDNAGEQQENTAAWPVRRILNAAARAVLGPPAPVAPVDREAAGAARRRTRKLHAGREGVEREVPVLPPQP